METKPLEGGGLSVPICYVTQSGARQWLEPQVLRHTLLEQLFSPQDLKSLLLVKLDRSSLNADNLKAARFEDDVIRKLTFSSDRNFYFADPKLAEQITQFFVTERDSACRYGSLLVSDCYKGTAAIDTLNLKLVDYTDPEFAAYKTHDCHGKISPQLLRSLDFEGATPDRPFQFRMAYTANRSSTLDLSFLAKGTVLVDPTLPSNVDCVLDCSSIKGIHKERLENLPCGDYKLSNVVLGNRANAEVSRYSNSWQFSMWYSKDAVLSDFLEPTLQKANALAEKQRNPHLLAQYVVQQYDQEQQSDSEGNEQEPQESRMISILRHDRYGLLLYAPKVVDFLESQIANRWRELAVNSGFQHRSGMAQPGQDLPRGTICAPHLPKGDVVVTRYPIVSSDNIRLYRNVHDPTLNQTDGVVWINPKDAAEYHQCDFDGDQLIATPTQWMPNIAKETLRAGEPNRFPSIVKRFKVPYTEVQDEQGQFVYNTLPKVAAAVCQNGIGRVATLIGRVHTAVATPEESGAQRQFKKSRHQLLNRLMAALQVEVDSPKSAERTETIDPKLLDDAKQWCDRHPSPFFDFQKDPRLYRQFALPTQAPGQAEVSIVCEIAAEINPLWEATQLQSMPREHFRYLFDRAELDTDALDWAENLKDRAQQATAQIRQLVGEDAEGFRAAIATLNESFRAEINEIFSTPEEQRSITAAVWYTQHTRPELDRPRKQSMSVAAKLPITFSQGTYNLPNSPYEVEACELSVPFDRAQIWMQTLEARHIKYEAIVNPALPVVDFYLPTLSERNAAVLQQQFGHQVIDVDRIPNDLRVVPPADFTWAHFVGDTGRASLAYTLMTEQVTERLQNFEVSQIKAIGIAHNDYAAEDFSQWQGRIEIEVVPYDLEPDHPKYHAMNGVPVLKVVNGGVLGTFAPETAKLPSGTRFEASVEDFTRSMVQLRVEEQSVLALEASIGEEISDEQNATQNLLVRAIAQTYRSLTSPTESVELPIGKQWTAIAAKNGDYTVEDNQGRLICQGNFETGEMRQPMHQSSVDEFQQMTQPRETASRKKQSIVER